jgi:hypothetical protein
MLSIAVLPVSLPHLLPYTSTLTEHRRRLQHCSPRLTPLRKHNVEHVPPSPRWVFLLRAWHDRR